MTTIAYEHKTKTIACDSQLTSDGFVEADTHIKMTKIDGIYWFFSGNEAHKNKFYEDFNFGEKTDFDFDCGAYRFDGKKVEYCCVENGVFQSYELTHNDAIGSGRFFAIASMDYGKCVKDAVEYAKTRDIYTGGTVNVYSLDILKKGLNNELD